MFSCEDKLSAIRENKIKTNIFVTIKHYIDLLFLFIHYGSLSFCISEFKCKTSNQFKYSHRSQEPE